MSVARDATFEVLLALPGSQAHGADSAQARLNLDSIARSADGRSRLVAVSSGRNCPRQSEWTWVFRGTRMPVAAVFENLEDGMTIDELVDLYDGLTREQVQAVLEFAARSLESSSITG
jgi:uncharacterized protein (DUF433 family)